MQVFSILITIFIVAFLAAFIGYNLYQIIKTIKEKNNKKGGKN